MMMMMNLFTFAREIGLAKHFSNFMCIIASLTRCAWAFPFSERSERSELPCQWFIHQLLWLWAPEAEGGLHSFIFLGIWTSNCHSREASESVINKNCSSLEYFSDFRSTEKLLARNSRRWRRKRRNTCTRPSSFQELKPCLTRTIVLAARRGVGVRGSVARRKS
jgi:hypothetical protein